MDKENEKNDHKMIKFIFHLCFGSFFAKSTTDFLFGLYYFYFGKTTVKCVFYLTQFHSYESLKNADSVFLQKEQFRSGQ